MSLRARLVVALVALFTLGMVIYGVGTYQAFARSELARVDEQLRGSAALALRELLAQASGRLDPGTPPDPRVGGRAGPRMVVAPGTFAQVRDPSGQPIETIQVGGDDVQPDLTGVRPTRDGSLSTVPSVEGEGSWRVGAVTLAGGRTVIVAIPMTSVEQTLDRLLLIQVTAGAALLAMLAGGAWLVLRSGLRPLERMAATADAIDAGSLERRVPMTGTGTEVGRLANAINGMLDELETAFRQRDATEARLRRFLSDASHELRTPLTSIQGYAELFRLGEDHDHVDLGVIMRRIEAESARMEELVEDLLTLARLDEAGPSAREAVDLAVLAADACSDAVAAEPGRPISLDAPEPVEALGDTSHLRQAIANLVMNAVRHTPPGTPITVTATDTGGRARVLVRDHGPGLDELTRAHLFERFWQANAARSGSGSGLGLSIVQAIATEHNGTVTADNAPGGGAVFALELPTTLDRQDADDR